MSIEKGFEVGKKFTIEIEITDQEKSKKLYEWMYDKDHDSPYGCKLGLIGLGSAWTRADMIQDLLTQMINFGSIEELKRQFEHVAEQAKENNI